MDTWDKIERLARELGASGEAIRKWRVRGVPTRWQLRFISHPVGRKLDRAAFDAPPGPRNPRKQEVAA